MSHPNVLHTLVKEFPSSDPLTWKPFYPTIRAVRLHTQRYGVTLCPLVGPYLHLLDVPVILASLCPALKIVINLRNPADLVFSHWKWFVLHRKRTVVDRISSIATFPSYVDTAIELFPEHPSPFGAPLHFGIYASAVARWLSAFGNKNVLILDVAGYFTDRNAYLELLEKFLCLPHAPLPPDLPVASRNPLARLAATPSATEKLKRFFEPYNRRLWEVIGTSFPW
jgi:hypothetical protein